MVRQQAPGLGIREVLARFWPYTRGIRGRLAIAIGLSLLVPLGQAGTIWMFKLLVDRVLQPHDLSAFWGIAAAYLAIALAGGVLGFADSYLGSWLSQQFTLAVRTDLFAHLHGLSLDALGRHPLGDVLSRLTQDVSAVESLAVSGVTRTVGNLAQVLVFAGALFWLSPLLAALSLTVTPLFVVAVRVFSVRIKRASRAARHHLGSMTAVAEESLANAALVQSLQRQDEEVGHFHREALARMRARLEGARLGAGFGPVVDVVELLGVLLVLGVGTWELDRGAMTLGGLLAFGGFLALLYSPVRSLARLANTVYSASAAAERISELRTTTSSVVDRPGAARIGRARGTVALDRVTFCYPGVSTPALVGVSLAVRPGQVLAVTGPSGSGKSTVARLLSRLYDVQAGAVRLDGHDVRELSLESLRRNVSLLLQESLVFHGSIRDNIGYGRPGATDGEIAEAAARADVAEFVERLPDGYDTVVGERGARLSGGQRQRLALARALLHDAPVLVLDEPTTGLDGEARERVLGAVRRVGAGRTTIVVTHDPETMAWADRVVRLEHGRLVGVPTQEPERPRQAVTA